MPGTLKFGGLAVASVLAGLAEEAVRSGIPEAWRGGLIVSAPKKALAPCSLLNAMGVICSPVVAKAYAKVLRARTVPVLVRVAGG